MKWLSRILVLLVALAIIGLLAIYLINRHINSFAAEKLETSITEIPVEDPKRIAIVFGALVWSDGEVSPVLYDRVLTAVELYRAGRVKKILMSGDNPTHQYDEPTAMKQTAIQLGVPEENIVLDYAGRRTYDTCYRAKEIFDVKKAILVTQEFHLPRAIYLCENLGIDSIGITADRRRYVETSSWQRREYLAVASAWLEINFLPFEPIGGKKEPIEP
jgi:vancomycin permeability regulator SanA